MNPPTPAIIAQGAVRRLPRIALLLLCVAYVVPGFIGRDPWKNADITGFGYMFELARGGTSWLSPTLLGQAPQFDALLPYWLGAWAVQLAPGWLAPDFAARIPFAGLLAVTLLATWYGVYHLARIPQAQPVAFAFGGEASPTDYARAMADAGLLALIACLGLAQFSHETTPSLAQLGFTAVSFYALAALPHRVPAAVPALGLGLGGLALSGAPSIAVLIALGGAALMLWQRLADGMAHGMADDMAERQAVQQADARSPLRPVVTLVTMAVLVAVLAGWLDLWRWRVESASGPDLRSVSQLLLWFTWPAGPLALWTLWRWRRHLASYHVALPMWFVLVSLIAALTTPSADRSLLLGLPALAALAAFALPTLGRTVAALIDWFTLLFFSGCAVIIWVVWISMQTGVPAKPAANVAKLAPGFEPSFSLPAFAAALLATVAWVWLVRWRTGRNRAAIWKSLVLPAGGAGLCWLLLMTLWLPALNYGRSYGPMMRSMNQLMQPPGCVELLGLTRAQVAAFRFHGGMPLQPAGMSPGCPWLVLPSGLDPLVLAGTDMSRWQLLSVVRRPVDAKDNLLLYKRAPP